tara:strand:+ start:43 stop:1293 length:1251 start_codon:yes stop_codon:yes gene_type:complete
MEFMMMQASPDADEIYTNREVLRYSADVTVPSSGSYTLNIPMYLAEMMENEYDQMNWKIIIDDNSPVIFYPTNESAQVTFSVTIPTGTTDTGQGNSNNQQSGNQISPIYKNGWALIIDVDEGFVDCSVSSYSINDYASFNDLDSLIQENEKDYNSLSSYHEFTNNDDNIAISCSGNVNFEQALDDMEVDFCAYLFLYGELKQSKCDSGLFPIATLSGQKTTLEEDLDDFEQDLADLENQWQNDLDDLFNTDDNSGFDDFDAEIDDSIDEFIDFMIGGIILGAPIYLIFVLVKKRREMQEEQEIKNEYDSFVNSFESMIKPKPVPHIEDTNSSPEPLEFETNQNNQPPPFNFQGEINEEENVISESTKMAINPNHRIPPFNFQGEINEDGWEVCEYPISSDIWWWKNYQDQCWEKWD